MASYAVVCFLNEDGMEGEESASEVPLCWLTQDQKKCWWLNTKNVGPLIAKRTIPDETDKKWQLHDIKCLGFYDNISSARQKADGFSSCDETPTTFIQTQKKSTLVTIKEEKNSTVAGKGKRKASLVQKKKDYYSVSDESDSDQNGIPLPPNLENIINEAAKPQDITLNKKSRGITVTSDIPVTFNLNRTSGILSFAN
ncbi:uncharacterized protein [Venturia canescens]|uniref:uncharacterized protein isoform X2 n=1 Tax=Venturia canescens TaxID=32260 RepID=UPI001C9D63AF|nr:uncharacterized protein LOC122415118 isoform X2 [Venturia canescens]XP_043282949.1 uncharacterized protein LOC122415118 isoform X2 [Venturia canescens]